MKCHEKNPDTEALRYLKMLVPILFYLLLGTSCQDPPKNNTPVLTVTVDSDVISPGKEVDLEAEVTDEDGDDVTVSWSLPLNEGSLEVETGLQNTWTAPAEDQIEASILVRADDGRGGISEKNITIRVINDSPVVTNLSTSSKNVLQGNSITLTCLAVDPNGGAVTYSWSSSKVGTWVDTSRSRNTATWFAPNGEDIYQDLSVTVTDAYGGATVKKLRVHVYSNYGVIWIADSGNKIVKKYSAAGEYLLTVQRQFARPIAIATNVDEFFGCFIADYDQGAVYKVSEKGELITTYSNFDHPVDIDIYKALRKIYVLDVGDNSVTLINGYTNTVVGKFTGFSDPHNIRINQETGDAWITDTGNNRIVRLAAEAMPDTIPAQDNGSGVVFYGLDSSFNEPVHLSFLHDSKNEIYIADYSDDEVETIKGDGDNFTMVSTAETTYGEDFDDPTYIAVSQTASQLDVIWVIENTRISYFIKGNLNPLYVDRTEIDYLYPYRIKPDVANDKVWIVDNGRNKVLPLKLDGQDVIPAPNSTVISNFIFIENIAINQ